MKFQVFQFQMSNEILDQVHKGVMSDEDKAVFQHYLNCTMIPTVERVIAAREFYKEVAIIEAEDLDQVFLIGNIGEDESVIKRIAPMHSISVGDVIVCNGIAHFVDRIGFKELTQYTANQVEEYVEFV
jgi:hypothetical protein